MKISVEKQSFHDKRKSLINNEQKYNSGVNKTKETKKKTMLVKITYLAIPSVISNLIVYLLETINLIFAGKVPVASSKYSRIDVVNAIGVGNIFMNFGGFLFGLGMITSLETLCSQAFGKNNLKELSKWVKICLYVMTVYFLILCCLCVFSKNIIMILGQKEYIAEIASKYIFSLIPAFLLQFYLAIYTKLLNSQQIFNPSLYINLICLLFHPLFCYIFYYLLELDIIGLGFSYNLTSLLMLIMTYSYVRIKKLREEISIKDVSRREILIFLKIAFQCGVLSSIDTLGFEILSFISSYLPQKQLDANICVINIYNNIYSISIGFATALTTLIGNFMGQNKPKTAIKYIQMGILLNFSLTVVISLCCIFFHKQIALIYIDDKSILKISSKLIRIVGIFIIFDALQLQMSGIIRGIGRQFIGMIIGVILFIFIQTAICAVFVFVLNFGVHGLWFGQVICVLIASIVYFFILKCSDWDYLAEEASKSIEEYKAEVDSRLSHEDFDKGSCTNKEIKNCKIYLTTSNSTSPELI